MSRPLGLTDGQIQILLAAASSLPMGPKRGLLLERFVAHLRLQQTNRPPTDAEVRAAVETAIRGLQQHEAKKGHAGPGVESPQGNAAAGVPR
jgi:hypothetical protein